MFLNVFILLFIIGIAYWQGLQGFFSAFLHLILVIVAGTIAFAFWEPISMGMLAGMMPRYAWGVGLVMPFVFILLLLRFLMDKLVPANVDFSQLTNLIAGGICGAIASVLTTGIFVISISYLPGATDNFGYRPYVVNPATGEVVKNAEGGGLWIGVDEIAANVFTTLSKGSFSPANGKSLASEQPDLIRRAHFVRLRSDPNSSTVATPESVKLVTGGHLTHPLPLPTMPAIVTNNVRDPKVKGELASDKHRLVSIDTVWTNLNKNYDSDRLRIYPLQVQLVTSEPGREHSPSVHLPFAVSKQTNKATNDREVTLVLDEKSVISSAATEEITVAFLFAVPKGHVERYLMVRGLRLALTPPPAQAEPQPDKIAAAIGTTLAASSSKAPPTTDPGTGTVGPTVGVKTGIKPEDVKVTAELPIRTSKNLAPELKYSNRNEIMGGTATAARPSGPISNANSVSSFYVPDGQAVVRVKVTKQVAESYLGQARAAAANLNAMFITDNEGNEWFPTGYVWYQTGSGAMNIRFEPQEPVRAISQLPIQKMDTPDELYLYFAMKKGVRLDKFKVGAIATTELNQLEVP